MQRVKRSSAVASLPAAPGGGTPGYFALPNPGGGVPATVPGYEWFNSIQEEICAVIAAAGIALDIANTGQLLAALRTTGVFATQATNDSSTKVATTAFVNPGSVLNVDGYVKLPCGLIVQWGLTASIASGANGNVTLPITYPSSNFGGVTTFTQSTDIGVGNVYIGQMRTVSLGSIAIRNLGPANAQYFYISVGK